MRWLLFTHKGDPRSDEGVLTAEVRVKNNQTVSLCRLLPCVWDVSNGRCAGREDSGHAVTSALRDSFHGSGVVGVGGVTSSHPWCPEPCKGNPGLRRSPYFPLDVRLRSTGSRIRKEEPHGGWYWRLCAIEENWDKSPFSWVCSNRFRYVYSLF